MNALYIFVLFLALALGALGGFASAYAVHWVLIHRMRGIDGLLRANYAIGKRAENRALRDERPQPKRMEDLTGDEILALARERGMTAPTRPRGE